MYIDMCTTNWILLYEACITKEGGLKLVKVDTMGSHCDMLILLSGAVLFPRLILRARARVKK